MLNSMAWGFGIVIGALSLTSVANADSSTWVGATSGAASVSQRGLAQELYPVLNLYAGMGTDPGGGLVFGGLAKTLTHFGAGTDLVLSSRTATTGFALGSWGLALDLGGYRRTWGADSLGFHGALIAGLPWGVNLGATAGAGSNDAQSFYLTLGFDWARLTAHRRDTKWWPSYPLPLRSETVGSR